jgi:hypothetical protein
MNKQVFALLLLNRFIGENFASETGGTNVGSIAECQQDIIGTT